MTDPRRIVAPERASEELFERMARRRPDYLLALLNAALMDGADTALALQVAARVLPGAQVRAALVDALDHASPIVRETAVYALAEHVHSPEICTHLRRHTRPLFEESAAVREAAADTLLLVDE